MMPKKPTPPALQVLFEPWQDTDEGPWDREGPEAFAGWYWFDALDEDGSLKPHGYRAYLSGCTVCRRADDNPRAHWNVANDAPSYMGTRKVRHCGTWKAVEKIVKAFGGWKSVHYVELAEHEGLRWQSLQGRAFRNCRTCAGAGFTRAHKFALREDCTDCKGSGNEIAIGPKLPDRHGMTDAQRRMR
jgi:hypothetical protein